MLSPSPRPEYHMCEGTTENLMRRARSALAFGVPLEDIVESLGLDAAEAYLVVQAAKLLGPLPSPRRPR